MDPTLLNSIGYRLKFEICAKFEQALAKGLKGATGQIAESGRSLAQNTRNVRQFEPTHAEVAKLAQASVLHSYDQTVTARKKVASYRIGENRLSGGVLRRALESPSMVRGTARGIEFVDQEVLNLEAKHWQRLNFGAGGVGANKPPGRFPVQFDQRVLFTLQFRAGPRPAFFMPFGMFLDEGGQRVGRNAGRRGMDRFQPTNKRFFDNPTRGIEARRFLDAGLFTISQELGPRYQRIFDRWAQEAVQASKNKPPA